MILSRLTGLLNVLVGSQSRVLLMAVMACRMSMPGAGPPEGVTSAVERNTFACKPGVQNNGLFSGSAELRGRE